MCLFYWDLSIHFIYLLTDLRLGHLILAVLDIFQTLCPPEALLPKPFSRSVDSQFLSTCWLPLLCKNPFLISRSLTCSLLSLLSVLPEPCWENSCLCLYLECILSFHLEIPAIGVWNKGLWSTFNWFGTKWKLWSYFHSSSVR